MRLINIHTLKITEFQSTDVPNYAILSHRWSDDEISMDDFINSRKKQSIGYQKIMGFCGLLSRRGEHSFREAYMTPGFELDWVWVDTCCIDKSSSVELSEAINSMYTWYQNAAFCIVHLADVDVDRCKRRLNCEPNLRYATPNTFATEYCEACLKCIPALRSSAWFSRGWTLQELIAPADIVFLNREWRYIGSKRHDLLTIISQITLVPKRILTKDQAPVNYSIAERLQWAARRITTRIEDQAYSLFGILNINLPLMYGEGEGAWRRLQIALIATSADESIFSWDVQNEGLNMIFDPDTRTFKKYWRCGIMSPSISRFLSERTAAIMETNFDRLPYTITNRGLEIRLQAGSAIQSASRDHYGHRWELLAVPLNCRTPDELEANIGGDVLVLARGAACEHYDRLICCRPHILLEIGNDFKGTWSRCEALTIYVHLDKDCPMKTSEESGQLWMENMLRALNQRVNEAAAEAEATAGDEVNEETARVQDESHA